MTSVIPCWAMSKDSRAWKIDEAQLLPPSVQDYLAKDYLSRLIVALVREELDLSGVSRSYRSMLDGIKGQSGQQSVRWLLARMTTKLRRAGYRSRYRLRKQVVEPVFGQIKQARGFCQFLLRGIEKVKSEQR